MWLGYKVEVKDVLGFEVVVWLLFLEKVVDGEIEEKWLVCFLFLIGVVFSMGILLFFVLVNRFSCCFFVRISRFWVCFIRL